MHACMHARAHYSPPLSLSIYIPTPQAQDLMWYFTKSYWNCHDLLWNNRWGHIFLKSNSHVKVKTQCSPENISGMITNFQLFVRMSSILVSILVNKSAKM